MTSQAMTKKEESKNRRMLRTASKHNMLMSQTLDYILTHLDEEPGIKELSAHFHYSENHFSKIFHAFFGSSCERFVTMLRMRKAAQILSEGEISPKELGEKYGFGTMSSFSKAFRREIGLSPRAFVASEGVIPDMPVPKKINGRRLFLRYIQTNYGMIYGKLIPLINGNNTDLLQECAYPLEHNPEDVTFDRMEDQIGFWWSDSEEDFYYVLGRKCYDGQEIPEASRMFEFPGSDYAVFALERSQDPDETLRNHRTMVLYALKIWTVINHKVGNTMLYTYETFGKDYTCLYLPLLKGMPDGERQENLGIDNWVKYIDDHITDDISLNEIAAHFHYSERHFRRVFQMYYDMSPVDYITKRRLYLAAGEIRHARNEEDRLAIVRKYYYRNQEAFRRQFEDEFAIRPEDYHKISVDAIDLPDYYSKNKDQVRIYYRNLPEIMMAGIILKATDGGDGLKDDLNIPDLASYWFINDTPALEGTPYKSRGKGAEDKIALWFTQKEINASGEETVSHEYILGPIISSPDTVPEGFKIVTLSAGRYAVFESMQESDVSNMSDVYRMLTRCSFYGWIRDNRFRVNFDRLTFVRFRGGKLRFYIPIYD